jgi:hypothetical protein
MALCLPITSVAGHYTHPHERLTTLLGAGCSQPDAAWPSSHSYQGEAIACRPRRRGHHRRLCNSHEHSCAESAQGRLHQAQEPMRADCCATANLESHAGANTCGDTCSHPVGAVAEAALPGRKHSHGGLGVLRLHAIRRQPTALLQQQSVEVSCGCRLLRRRLQWLRDDGALAVPTAKPPRSQYQQLSRQARIIRRHRGAARAPSSRLATASPSTKGRAKAA